MAADLAELGKEGLGGGLGGTAASFLVVVGGGVDGVRAGVEEVGTANRALRPFGDGQVGLDADAAKDVATGQDRVPLLHALWRLFADGHLADRAVRVEGAAVIILLAVLVVAGHRSLDGRLGHAQGGRHGDGTDRGKVKGKVNEVGGARK